jgi:predicted enzyme related to lactoylglutathione lyase
MAGPVSRDPPPSPTSDRATESTRGAGGVLALARTDDAEQALAAVRAAGGRVVVDLHEYPGGRRFTFADPWGNVLGVYEPTA